MQRPNRIGSPPILDLSATQFTLDQSVAEYAASVGTISAHQVQAHTATLGDPVSTVNFDTADNTTAWSLPTQKSWSFGVFTSGAPMNNAAQVFSFSGAIHFHCTASSPNMVVALNCGYANATSVTVDKTTTTNLMDTKATLASDRYTHLNQSEHSLEFSGTFVNTLFNGGASGEYDTNPLGLWFSITNHSGGALVTNSCNGYLSLYKYLQDIDTFDPTR